MFLEFDGRLINSKIVRSVEMDGRRLSVVLKLDNNEVAWEELFDKRLMRERFEELKFQLAETLHCIGYELLKRVSDNGKPALLRDPIVAFKLTSNTGYGISPIVVGRGIVPGWSDDYAIVAPNGRVWEGADSYCDEAEYRKEIADRAERESVDDEAAAQ